MLKGQIKTGV